MRTDTRFFKILSCYVICAFLNQNFGCALTAREIIFNAEKDFEALDEGRRLGRALLDMVPVLFRRFLTAYDLEYFVV